MEKARSLFRPGQQTRIKKAKITTSCAMIFAMFLVLSCSGPAMRGTKLVTTPTSASTQVVVIVRPHVNATSKPAQKPLPTSVWTHVNASFPGLADTTSNIHIALPFDFKTNPTAMAGKIDLVLGTIWAGSLPGNVYSLFYLPYDRDEDPRYYSAAHDITWCDDSLRLKPRASQARA